MMKDILGYDPTPKLMENGEGGMTDRGKVIKGLECCSQMVGEVCRNCPYSDECYLIEDYGKEWLPWTSRPTDEQREKVKWNDQD